jgi:hypothetical protein
VGRVDGKRGPDRYVRKGWTAVLGLGRVGVRVEEVGARLRSLLGIDWIEFGQRRSLCRRLVRRAGDKIRPCQQIYSKCMV